MMACPLSQSGLAARLLSLTVCDSARNVGRRTSHLTSSRCMATEASQAILGDTLAASVLPVSHTAPKIPSHIVRPSVSATVYQFPEMEPNRLVEFPSNHLYLPLRRDILHRAIVYEGDKTRQGTASTKWRREVHGSTRKLAPQKGMGRARVGDRKSPIRVGGGRAFGPKPRDFSTGLQKKVYDLAWRTALSYRYRRGELVIIETGSDLIRGAGTDAVDQVFGWNGFGKGYKGSLFVTYEERPHLFRAMSMGGSQKHGFAATWDDIDVKNILTGGSVIIEYKALKELLRAHQSDIQRPLARPGLLSLSESSSVNELAQA